MRLDHLLSKENVGNFRKRFSGVLGRKNKEITTKARVRSTGSVVRFSVSLETGEGGTACGERDGGVAQLGEHLPCKQGVRGSNPLTSTKMRSILAVWLDREAVGACPPPDSVWRQ